MHGRHLQYMLHFSVYANKHQRIVSRVSCPFISCCTIVQCIILHLPYCLPINCSYSGSVDSGLYDMYFCSCTLLVGLNGNWQVFLLLHLIDAFPVLKVKKKNSYVQLPLSYSFWIELSTYQDTYQHIFNSFLYARL